MALVSQQELHEGAADILIPLRCSHDMNIHPVHNTPTTPATDSQTSLTSIDPTTGLTTNPPMILHKDSIKLPAVDPDTSFSTTTNAKHSTTLTDLHKCSDPQLNRTRHPMSPSTEAPHEACPTFDASEAAVDRSAGSGLRFWYDELEVRDAGDGKGRGVFATAALPPGTLLLEEVPRMTASLGAMIEEVATDRPAFAILGTGNTAGHSTSAPESATQATACLQVKANAATDRQGRVLLHMGFSMLNHSCWPNAAVFVEEIGTQTVTRVLSAAALEVGEEVTIPYRPGIVPLPRAERRRRLEAVLQLDCACRRCGTAEPERDALLTRGEDLAPLRPVPEDLDDLLGFLATTRLAVTHWQRREAAWAAVQQCCRVGRWADAARLALDVVEADVAGAQPPGAGERIPPYVMWVVACQLLQSPEEQAWLADPAVQARAAAIDWDALQRLVDMYDPGCGPKDDGS